MTWLINPFRYVAGAKALLYGLAAMLLTAAIAFYSRAHFDGVIDMHTGFAAPFTLALLEQLVVWIIPVLVLYTAARVFSTSGVRFIDIAGTLALARAPMIFAAILSFAIPQVSNLQDIGPVVIALSFVVLAFGAWMIVLMYQAFIVSANIRGRKALTIFIISLVLSEVLSKVVFHFIYPLFIKG